MDFKKKKVQMYASLKTVTFLSLSNSGSTCVSAAAGVAFFLLLGDQTQTMKLDGKC